MILRPPLVYGPGVKPDFLRLLRTVDRALPVPLWILRFGARLLGRGADFEPLAGDLAVDASAIRRELGGQPPYSMRAGLAETARWYRSLTG